MTETSPTETSQKHGIELRFGKGRRLALLSYAVWVKGRCHVDHDTTAANRRLYGSSLLVRLVALEQDRDPSLRVI